MPISVLIVEDNPQASCALRHILQENATLSVLNDCNTLADAEIALFQHHPSLLFLDIELPDGSGIEFWDRVRRSVNWNIYTIFYTAFDQYVIDALRAKAHDYLIKPVIRSDVMDALQRFYLHCAESFAQDSKNADADSAATAFFVQNSEGDKVVLKPSDIGYFRYQPERKAWTACSIDGADYELHHGINSARIIQLSPDFIQVHKSYIINISFLYQINSNQLVFLSPFDKVDFIMVSKVYRDALFTHFCQL